MEKGRRRLFAGVDLFTLWLFGAWSLYVVLVYPSVAALAAPFSRVLAEGIRFFILAAPAMFLIYGVRSTLRLGPLGPALKAGALVSLAWIAGSATFGLTLQGLSLSTAKLDLVFWLTTFSVSCLSEEIAFRGTLLRGWLELGRRWAIPVSALCFVFIHVPGWVVRGMFLSPLEWVITPASIFILGLVIGWLYTRYRSIWPGVMLHAANNLAAAVLV